MSFDFTCVLLDAMSAVEVRSAAGIRVVVVQIELYLCILNDYK